MNKKTLLLLFLIVVNPSFLPAQSFQIRTYTLEDGLSTNVVYDAKQDKQGQMWFSTERGISRYDGLNWTNYESKDGLPQTDYFRIQIDSSNTIWAAPIFMSYNVAYFKENRWQLIPLPSKDLVATSQLNAFELQYDNGKLILCLGTKSGLFFFKDERWTKISKSEGLLNNFVYSVKNSGSKFFVGTGSGLSIIENGKVDNSLNKLISTSSKAIFAIDIEKDKNEEKIWLLGKDWIGFINNGKFQVLTNRNLLRNSPASFSHYFLLSDRNQKIFYGNYEEKFYFNKNSKEIKNLGLLSGLISEGGSNIFLDKEENIWIPTHRGIDKINSMCFENYSSAHGLLENEVSAIFQVRPGYFIFGHNTGITLLKDEKFKTISFKNLLIGRKSNARILEIAKDSDGNIWFAGSYLGLGKLVDENRIEWMEGLSNRQCTAISVDSNGNLWASINDQIYMTVNNKLQKVYSIGTIGNISRKLLFTKDNKLLAATLWGMYIFKDGKHIDTILEKNRLSNNCYALSEYKDNKYFLGTAGGLHIYDGKSLEKFNENNFSIDHKVFSIYKDRNKNFWFGTNDGVIRWDGAVSRKYSVEDGLAGRELNRAALCEDDNGRIWFGTDRGLSSYNRSYDYGDRPPKVKLNYLENSDGKRFELSQPIELSSIDATVILTFKSISFINEKNIRYQVKLAGFDVDWIDIGLNNEIRYTSLGSGKYTFLVRAKNLSGSWGPISTSNEIIINKPFYNQWWFYLILFSAAASLTYFGYGYLSNMKYRALLEKEVAVRTHDLKESENKLQTIIQSAPNIVSIIDADGNVNFLNLIYEEQKYFTGSKGNIYTLLGTEKSEVITEYLGKVFKSKEKVFLEHQIILPTGKTLWFASFVSPIVNEGTVSEAIAISVDISQRKKYEWERKEIEDRQNAILEALPIIFYAGSTNSNVGALWMTDNAFSVTGFPISEFITKEFFWTSRIHEKDKKRVIEDFEKVSVGKSVKLEYRWRCADGTYKWFLDYAFPQKVEDDGNVHYLGLWLDISEQKKIQLRLEKLNKCLLSFGVDPELNINRLLEFACEELEAAFGLYNCFSDGKLIPMAKWNIPDGFVDHNDTNNSVCSEILEDSSEMIRVIKNLGTSKYAEFDQNIRTFNLKTYIGVAVNFGGSIKGSLCVVYHEDKEPTSNDLDFISIISSAIAVEEERRLSQEVIRHSLEEKEILLKEIHHRVKNNLQIISSLLYLQTANVDDPKTKSMFDDSIHRIKTMAIIHEKLYRSEDFTQIDMNEYIKSLATSLFETFANNKMITSKINIENLFLPVDTAIPIGLILNELVTNSIKYAFPSDIVKNPEILISLDKDEDKIYFRVSDNGIGLPEEINLDNINLSLGLKLVQLLTAQMKGDVKIEREGGTKFSITI